MKAVSINGQVTGVVFAAIGCTLALAALSLAWFERSSAHQRLESALAALVQASAPSIITALDSGDTESVSDKLGDLTASDLVVDAWLVLADGSLVSSPAAGTPERSSPPAGAGSSYLKIARDRVLYTTPLDAARNGPGAARLHLLADPTRLGHDNTFHLGLLGAALIITLATGTLFSRLLQRALTRPISQLAETVARVHLTGDYSARAAVAGRDEIGRLAATFNEMLAGIATRDRQIVESSVLQQAVLENTGVAVISTAPDGIIRTFNAAAEKMLGLSRDDMVGRLTPVVFHDPAELERRAADLSIQLGRSISPGFNLFRELVQERPGALEWTYIRRDGSRLPVLLVLSTMRTPEGEVLGLCGIATDLTERKRSEDQIRRLNTELEERVRLRTAELNHRVAEVERLNLELRDSESMAEHAAAHLQEANANLLVANQELEAFSYSVSHDLRSPLRNISGFITLLRTRLADRLDEESDRFLGIVTSESVRMGSLIDDLLTFSRVGRTEMTLEPVDIAGLLDEVRQELHHETEGRPIEWRIHPLPRVHGDRTLLRQVLANLVGNAVKFTRRRTPAVIEVGVHPPAAGEHQVTFFIRDNGAGFNPQYVGKLFRVFQRLHNSREFEGTGIGLANVKRIVTRHRGRVWAEGAEDSGATFYFTLKVSDT